MLTRLPGNSNCQDCSGLPLEVGTYRRFALQRERQIDRLITFDAKCLSGNCRAVASEVWLHQKKPASTRGTCQVAAATMPNFIKQASSMVSNVRDWVHYGKYFPKPNASQDIDLHIKEAAAWLVRAQDAGHDRGVAYGAVLGEDFLASYPETTGYIIPTFLKLAEFYKEPDYLSRAFEMGCWEVALQLSSGAVMAGRADSKHREPAIFNTGQVLLGWSALQKERPDAGFRSAGIRAADWLLSKQEEDGNWIHGNSPLAKPGATVYNVKAAWGLAEFGAITSIPHYVDAAIKNAEYAMRHQLQSGWFEKCCLTDSERPLLHTIAYAMQGLIGIGRRTKRADFIQAAQRTADSLLKLMDSTGFIPGTIDRHFRGAAHWCCLTGTAQTSVVWAELYQITGGPRYREAAQRANRYLMSCHDTSSPIPTIRGGITGSWPVWGDYGRYKTLNWATKFFLDALLLEKQLAG